MDKACPNVSLCAKHVLNGLFDQGQTGLVREPVICPFDQGQPQVIALCMIQQTQSGPRA